MGQAKVAREVGLTNRDLGIKAVMIDDIQTTSDLVNSVDKISVDQIESIGNLNVTGSLGVNFIEINGEVDWPIVNEGDTPAGIIIGGHRIFSSKLNKNLAIHSNYPINIHLGKVIDENSKLNITGSVKLHGDNGLGRINPFDTTLEVIGNSEFSGSIMISGSNSIVVLPNHSTAPTSPSPGALYFNTTNFHFYGWNGSVWKQLDN